MSEDKVYSAIKRIYASSKKPLLLSTLGYALRNEGCAIAGGIKGFINEIDGFVTVQHPDIKEKIAISTTDEAEETLSLLLNTKAHDSDADMYLDKIASLHRNALLAFCANTHEDSYLSTIFPFKFYHANKINNNLKLITKEQKKEIYIPSNISRLSPEDARTLYETIESWCASSTLDIGIFKNKEKQHNIKNSNAVYKISSEISLFIECQPDDVKKKIVIPMCFLEKA